MKVKERFNEFHLALSLDSLQRVEQVYHPRVTFVTPSGVHQGLEAVGSYFRTRLVDCGQFGFQINRQHFQGSQGFVDWTLTFRNPRINNGEPTDVQGRSVLRIRDDRIDYQRDYFDAGAAVFDHIPVLGPVVRYFRRRVAA